MPRRRLYGETQKRRKKVQTARLKRSQSVQRVESTQVPAPFERSGKVERQDLEFLEVMREMEVAPNRRRPISSVRQRRAEEVHFEMESRSQAEFLDAMDSLGVRPPGQGNSGRKGSAGVVPDIERSPNPASPLPEADPIDQQAGTGELPAAPDRVAYSAANRGRAGNQPAETRFEDDGTTMEELLAESFDPARKYDGAPPPPGPRGERPTDLEDPDDVLDLHGKTQEEAIRMVQSFLLTSHRNRARAVLIVTGKGHNSGTAGPVLRQAVNSWLERNGGRYAKSHHWAPSRHGGDGAIWVTLR